MSLLCLTDLGPVPSSKYHGCLLQPSYCLFRTICLCHLPVCLFPIPPSSRVTLHLMFFLLIMLLSQVFCFYSVFQTHFFSRQFPPCCFPSSCHISVAGASTSKLPFTGSWNIISSVVCTRILESIHKICSAHRNLVVLIFIFL